MRHLHLREGAAGRRIGAMRVLRRLPQLEPALRDGRLCLSTVCVLGPLLTADNHDEFVRRAAYRTKGEVEHLVASIRPRAAPKEGIRKLPVSRPAVSSTAPLQPQADAPAVAEPSPLLSLPVQAARSDSEPPPAPAREPIRSRPEVRPVSEGEWSFRVTIDAELKADIETLKALLSHKVPDGNLTAVLREAIRCAIEKHGRRKGAVPPSRGRRSDPVPLRKTDIPASLRREVWKRDGGACTWRGRDGRRCGSRWQVEIDHIRPKALGGAPTAGDLRLLCRPHNIRYAEQVYGREHMGLFRRAETLERGGPLTPSEGAL